MKTTFVQRLVLTAGLAAGGLLLAGCGGYYYEGYYADGGGVQRFRKEGNRALS
jgi:hypothetical protein